MTDARNAMEELGEESCWAMLAAVERGRPAPAVPLETSAGDGEHVDGDVLLVGERRC